MRLVEIWNSLPGAVPLKKILATCSRVCVRGFVARGISLLIGHRSIWMSMLVGRSQSEDSFTLPQYQSRESVVNRRIDF